MVANVPIGIGIGTSLSYVRPTLRLLLCFHYRSARRASLPFLLSLFVRVVRAYGLEFDLSSRMYVFGILPTYRGYLVDWHRVSAVRLLYLPPNWIT